MGLFGDSRPRLFSRTKLDSIRSLHTIELNSAIVSFLHLLRRARIQPLQLSKFPES